MWCGYCAGDLAYWAVEAEGFVLGEIELVLSIEDGSWLDFMTMEMLYGVCSHIYQVLRS